MYVLAADKLWASCGCFEPKNSRDYLTAPSCANSWRRQGRAGNERNPPCIYRHSGLPLC
jgi:hypothetical protein